jgi:hypothetical protein
VVENEFYSKKALDCLEHVSIPQAAGREAALNLVMQNRC